MPTNLSNFVFKINTDRSITDGVVRQWTQFYYKYDLLAWFKGYYIWHICWL